MQRKSAAIPHSSQGSNSLKHFVTNFQFNSSVARTLQKSSTFCKFQHYHKKFGISLALYLLSVVKHNYGFYTHISLLRKLSSKRSCENLTFTFPICKGFAVLRVEKYNSLMKKIPQLKKKSSIKKKSQIWSCSQFQKNVPFKSIYKLAKLSIMTNILLRKKTEEF